MGHPIMRILPSIMTRSPLGYFLQMLVRPARGITRVVTERPAWWSLVFFLTVISLLRGILDGVLVLLSDGQLFSLWHAGRLPGWFVFKASPLLLADWLAVYVRWLGFALVPYLLGRFCGGVGRLHEFLRVYGIALGVYVVTVLPNFAYFFVPLPMVRFEAAPMFNPTLGVGQIITSTWLAWVSYAVVRHVHRLPRFEAASIGVLTPTLNIAALVLPGAVIFNLPHVRAWGAKAVTYSTLLGFSAASLLIIAALVLLVRRLQRSEARMLRSEV